MSIPIISIVIGVSKYQNLQLDDLPAAQADALFFAQSLHNWGVDDRNIHLFLNEEATEENVLQCLRELKGKSNLFKFVFYYCGHGYRSPPPDPKSHLILHQSQIHLDCLLKEICQLHAKEIYLFIDACQLRINSLINPELEREIQNKKDSRKSLFCILSSGIEKSFEDVEEEYGYFTNSLLKGLSALRQGENTPTTLLEKICKDLRQRGLALPEMYNIETHRIDFFPPLSSSGLTRMPIIARIQDQIIQNPRKILCLIGEKGIGKTTLCKLLASAKCFIFHFEQLPSFEEIPAYSLIIIDSVETREPQVLNYLIEILREQKAKFILTTQKSFRSLLSQEYQNVIEELEIPPLDFEEANTLIDHKELDYQSKEIIFLASKGNPQKIKNILFGSSGHSFKDADRDEIKKAIAAIVACGMYLNEELFCRIYKLQQKTLAFIEEIGLISADKNAWIPHESLFDIADSEDLVLDPVKALEYWSQQIDETPDPQAAKSFILTLKCFGYVEAVDRYLLKAFEILKNHALENLCFFNDGVDIFIARNIFSKTVLFLTDILLELGEIEKAEDLLSIPSKNSPFFLQARIRKFQCLWRKGDFQNSIKQFSQLIESIPQNSLWIECLLNRGNANFFLGYWEKAKRDFLSIIENTKTPQYLGRAQCMIGSILGIRGIDSSQGKNYLESGIRLLIKNGDYTGAWVGWNNLGEMLWKLGEYRLSNYHLKKAFDVTINPSMKLETLRNLLQLNVRAKGPSAKEVNEFLDQIQSINLSEIEKYEQIQLLNTLAEIFLLRNEVKKAIFYLWQVIPMTSSNQEQHFYTLVNLSLLFKIFNFEKKSEYYQKRAIFLAEKSNNKLAIEVMKQDFTILEMSKRAKSTLQFYP